jgi:hypothetical protein
VGVDFPQFLPSAIIADGYADSAVTQLRESSSLASLAQPPSGGEGETVDVAPFPKGHDAIIVERAITLARSLATCLFR